MLSETNRQVEGLGLVALRFARQKSCTLAEVTWPLGQVRSLVHRLARGSKRAHLLNRDRGHFLAVPDEIREDKLLDTTPNARLQAFLGKFDAALAAGDIDAAVAMFAVDSYWRDLVAFTWNIKTVEGRDQVRDMLAHCLKRVKPRDWRIAEGNSATEAGGMLESWISFETEIARGYGLIRLKDGLIWTLLTTMA